LGGIGSLAEYVCVPEHALALKPANVTFEEAATIPSRATIALQGLRDKGQIQLGHHFLMNGAGGGVGTFAVQLAKYFGADVTGVDSTGKLDMLRSIGADYVVDYTQEDFTKSGQRYDLILDVAAHHSIFDYKRALRANGIYLMVGGSWTTTLQVLFLGPLISLVGSKKLGILPAKPSKDDLIFIKELVEAGQIIPIIDRCYPLPETAEAFRYLEAGHHRGKVVITVKQTCNAS
jgi:NADPH:quinone reductase-like Zn-dependent oxidoreductase